jgi:hypothetical protein
MKRRRVIISQAIAGQLRLLRIEAVKKGRGVSFLQALQLLVERLQTKPLPPALGAFGCPEYHLPKLHLVQQ